MLPSLHFLIIILAALKAVSTSINPERAQLLKDALSWMTFRKNGQLMTNTEVESLFLKTLEDKYTSSSYYRTFVIAFQQGVLPSLTLNENDPCDPAYTKIYKDPFNNSVTWHYQKRFTFRSYDKRKTSDAKYCDYRQGLVCKSSSRTCQCAEGSKMEAVDAASSIKRCLVQENQVCGLIDIDHGNDPMHSALASNLHYLIFNLEKPPSCKTGTQCRFKSSNLKTPLCYDANSGSFAPPYTDSTGTKQTTWKNDFGTECALDLYADPGSCTTEGVIGYLKGYTCFNFGPPKSQRSSMPELRTGFCAHEYGPLGITNLVVEGNHQKNYHTVISSFIHPRTVPFRDKELESYTRNLYDIFPLFGHRSSAESIQSFYEGNPCSAEKTKKFEDVWKYFQSLEEEPPPGRDYVQGANKIDLDANLQDFIDLTKGPAKFCKIYVVSERFKPELPVDIFKSLKCDKGYTPNPSGNDGKCKAPGNVDTQALMDKLQAFQDKTAIIDTNETEEFREWRKAILREYPEDGVKAVTCPPPGSPSSSVCPALEFVCYKDYGDMNGIYDSGTCTLKMDPSLITERCHDDSRELTYGKCEAKLLDGKILEEFEKMVEYARLERGAACHYNTEKGFRNWIRKGHSKRNKYKTLEKLERWRWLGSQGLEPSGDWIGMCDRTKLLECSNSNSKNPICECVNGTEPRKVMVFDKEYLSDYCYLAKGKCELDSKTFAEFTASEKEGIMEHYGVSGEAGEDCGSGNLCVFWDGRECTADNTGGTGYDGKPPVTIKPGNGAGGPGHRFAGQGQDLRGSSVLTGWSLMACVLYEMKFLLTGI